MNRNKWLWGIFFILSAVFLVASQVTDFVQINIWSILGGILLIAVITQSLIHRNFFGAFVPVAFLYQIFWQPLNLPQISIWILLAATVLMVAGFSYLFRPHPIRWRRHVTIDGDRPSQCTQNADDNNPEAQVSFGSMSKYLHADALRTGRFAASFGSLEVYLDQAVLSPEGADIFVESNFGSIELSIPRGWRVKNRVQVSFGNVEIDEHRFSADADAPSLTISGSVAFGSVEVRAV